MDPTPANSSFLPSNPWAPPPSDNQNSAPVPKAKLLCSFGGRILPRPGDSVLRYIGGHTRLISVQKDLSFNEFMRKLSGVINSTDQEPDPISPGSQISVKYQLPGEDLDALVSVSCQEDLENMIEEYDKLAASCSDGSAKLRVFLFPQSEPDLAAVAPDETGQKYIEAINSAGPGNKESVTSAGSAVNPSESTHVLDGFESVHESMSPPVQSPTTYMANPGFVLPDQNLAHNIPPQPVPVAAYVTPQGFVESQQVAYLNPHQIAGNMSANMVPLAVNAFTPAVPVTGQNGAAKPVPARVEPIMDSQYVTRPMQPIQQVQPLTSDINGYKASQPLTSDQGGNYKVLQPLSQLPPIPPTYIQHQHSDTYATRGVAPVRPHGNVPAMIYGDCAMCQKALPHQHSDNMISEPIGNASSPGAGSEVNTNPVFYSIPPENVVKQPASNITTNPIAINPVSTCPVTGNPVSTNLVTPIATGQTGVHGIAISQGLDPNIGSRRPVIQTTEASDPTRNVHNTPLVAPSGGIPGSNGLYLAHRPQKNIHDQFQQTQPIAHPYWSTTNQSLYQVQPDVLSRNTDFQTTQPSQDQGAEFLQNFVSSVDARVQALNLGSAAPREPNLQGTVLLNQIHDNSFLQPYPDSYVRPQVRGSVLMNTLPNPVMGHEQNFSRPMQQPPVSVQPVILSTSQEQIVTGNNRPYTNNAGVPVYSQEMHSSQFVPPQHVKNIVHPPKSTVNEQDSLFSNQDPWKAIGGNANLVPPMPTRLANNKELHGTARDLGVENNIGASSGLNTIPFLEEGNLPKKETGPDSVRGNKGEEIAKRQLQAVAEGVAAAVLQSSLSGGNNTLEKEKEAVVPPSKADLERVMDAKVEVQEMKNNQLDKVNPGVPLVDDNIRLQIIKNSDLEELRELGSGTFGTVYHGKWRGTDVAIKRINDRCFAGKASEQERLRSDFWNEAGKLSSLHHPNVVAFYGVVVDGPGGSVATVTEYMANGSLRQALQRNDKILDRRRRLVIAMDVAFGMEYLHDKNIVHFDLKSDNLLVNLRDPHRPICKAGLL
ncbi:RAF-like serine/threonine-protein kinase 20 isoform X2 [Carex rostrata]